MYIPCELVAQAIKIQPNTGIDRIVLMLPLNNFISSILFRIILKLCLLNLYFEKKIEFSYQQKILLFSDKLMHP